MVRVAEKKGTFAGGRVILRVVIKYNIWKINKNTAQLYVAVTFGNFLENHRFHSACDTSTARAT